MSKKKVLFVVHQLNYGGVQKALLSALNAIDFDRYDVTLYVRKARLDLLPDVDKRVSEVIINDDKRHYYRTAYAIWKQFLLKCYSLCGNKTKADGIRCQLGEHIADQKIQYEKKHFFSDGKRYDVAIAYIQGYPAKLVANCVDADRKIMFYHGSTDEHHSLHEAIFDRIDTIVGVNKGVQEVLENLYPAWKNKMTYLTNYVDADEIREKSRQSVVESETDRVILCTCGRLTPVKGFDLAVKAAKILKDAGEKFVWYFVGDGPERSKLQGMIKEYGLDDHVILTGMQSNPYPWIKACDIYVQPSYEEAHPLSIVEAQILCKPVVSTATIGGKGLVKDQENGIVCAICHDALANSISSLNKHYKWRMKMEQTLMAVDREIEFDLYKSRLNSLLEV